MKRTIALSSAAILAVAAGFAITANGATVADSSTSISAYTTGYSYFDNTPPGSADISHPVLHNKAGGTGTYKDPVTLAVGHSITNKKDTLDVPAGTIFYIPNLRKYVIVEDSCGDGNTPQNGPCHSLKSAPKGAEMWVDIWVGGQGATQKEANNCMSVLTDGNGPLHTIIREPATNYVVVPGDIVSKGVCHINYGNTATVDTPTSTPSNTPTTPGDPTDGPTGTPTKTPIPYCVLQYK